MITTAVVDYFLAEDSARPERGAANRHGRTYANAPASPPPEPVLATSVPAAGTAELRAWARALGDQLAQLGPKPVERELRALAGAARRHQVAGVSSCVLVDRRQPDVARARAFSRVVTALVELAPATQASVA